MIDYDAIAQALDRTQTLAIIDRLRSTPDLSVEELKKAEFALCELCDPRSEQALRDMFMDQQFPDGHRKRTGEAWYSLTNPDNATIRNDWAAGGADPVLRDVAVNHLTQTQHDLIDPILANPEHDLFAAAIGSLTFGFSDRYLNPLIAALDSENPDIRAEAADSLFWNEPIRAEPRLLEMATADTDPDARKAAIGTLRYYYSQTTLRTMAELRQSLSPDDPLFETVSQTCTDLVDTFESTLQDEPGLAAWMEPVADLIQLEVQAEEPPTAAAKRGPAKTKAWMLSLTEFEQRYGEVSRPDWKRLQRELFRLPYINVPEGMRPELKAMLLASTDPILLQSAARCFGAWQDLDGLKFLLPNRYFLVRKSAFYYLHECPPDADLADQVWERVTRGDVCNTHASEMLSSAISLTPDAALKRQRALSILADEAHTEDLRGQACAELEKLKARDELASQMDILSREPATHWGLVLCLIDAAKKMKIPLPDLSHLREVDNLHLQESLVAVA